MKKMKIALILVLAAGALAFTGEKAMITPFDINKLTGDAWQGNYAWMNDSTLEMNTANGTLTVTPDEKDPLVWTLTYDFPDAPDKNKVTTLEINKTGDVINGEEISDRAVTKEGVLKLITMKKTKTGLMRCTYRISENTFSLKKEKKDKDDTAFALRAQYDFTRNK